LKKSGKIPVTVLIAAKNEALNLPKCLYSLRPAVHIFLLDSQSTDGTQKIAKKFGAKVIQFNYKGGYPKKRQWALDHLKISTPWVLLIDADEEVPKELWEQIGHSIKTESSNQAYLLKKEFHFLGKKFRFGGFSFDAVLLFRKGKARFEQLIEDSADALDMEVHERLIVDGPIGKLKSPLLHNDFKGLEAYIDRHRKYSTWEAKLRKSFLDTHQYGKNSIQPNLFGNSQERRRFLKKIAVRIPGEPLWWFIYHYFLRLGFLEGWRGFIASKIRAQYIFQVRSKLFELQKAENER
jgi:glycosyltransferase involved in cell wall biosynthesis